MKTLKLNQTIPFDFNLKRAFNLLKDRVKKTLASPAPKFENREDYKIYLENIEPETLRTRYYGISTEWRI